MCAAAGSGRQVAQGAKAYRERGGARERPDDRIQVKAEVDAADEADALARLAAAGAAGPHRWVGAPCLHPGMLLLQALAMSAPGSRTSAGRQVSVLGEGSVCR